MKNRKLNDLVNKSIYGQTQGNIDKTLNVFKKRPGFANDERMQGMLEQKPESESDDGRRKRDMHALT